MLQKNADMAKIKLDVTPYAEIGVIAVCAPMRDYRFIWHINNHLLVNYVQDAPFTWPHKKLKESFDYAVFRCPENPEILVLNNRNENVQLIPTLPTIDFFIVFSEEMSNDDATKWMKGIKSIQGITLAMPLTGKNLDEFRPILSEMEYQEMHRNKEEKQKNRGY